MLPAFFFGTFSPFHQGHLSVAEAVQVRLGYSRIDFVLSPNPPHKQHLFKLTPQDRLAILQASIKRASGMDVDMREMHRLGPCFTIDTLTEIATEYMTDKIPFIVGYDSFASLPSWYRYRDIIDLVHFLIVPRGSRDVSLGHLDDIKHTLSYQIIDMEPVDISSSMIEALKREGKPYRDLLIPEAYDIYRDISSSISVNQLK